jgi:hypothetical protein
MSSDPSSLAMREQAAKSGWARARLSWSALWRDALCWGIGALALALWLRIALQGMSVTLASLDNCPTWSCDFVRCYLPEARLLGAHAYVLAYGWHYPPLLAIALSPLRHFGVRGATAIWTAVSVAAALVVAYFCAAELRGRSLWARGVAGLGLVAICLPVIHGIKWGQVSMLLCALVVYALVRRSRWTGPLVGLAAAIKMYPFAYLLGSVVRREVKVLLWAAGTVLGVGVLLPLILLGKTRCLIFARDLFGVFEQPLSWLGAQSLSSTMARWFIDGAHIGLEGSPGPLLVGALSSTSVQVVSWALALCLVALAVRRLWRVREDAALGGALCLVAVTLALQPSWHHYFSFLPFCQAVAVARAGGRSAALWLASASVALAVVPLALLVDDPSAYFIYSRWGGTTVAALLCYAALMLAPAKVSSAQAQRAQA